MVIYTRQPFWVEIIIPNGVGGKSKNQIMDIGCQCSPIYHGAIVDKATGTILGCSDYRDATYYNDCKNQHHGQKGRNASHQTDIKRRLSKLMDICPFSLSIFQDDTGYYMKSTATGENPPS
jgi:hypothetical protein